MRGAIKMKIGDDVWSIIFTAVVVGILAINMISPHWVYLWLSIGGIIGVFIFISPLFGIRKKEELDELYCEYYTLYEELLSLKGKKKTRR